MFRYFNIIISLKNKDMLKIGLTNLSTKQLDYLAEQTIALSEMNSNTEIIENPVFGQIKTVHRDYRAVVMKQTYSGLGESLSVKDIFRDNCYTNLSNIVSGFAMFEGSPKQAPSLHLKKIFDEAGSIVRLNYADESVVIEKVTERLSTPESKSAISALGITAEVSLFVNAQREFNELYLEQVNANSDLRQQPSASSMRGELENVLRSYYALVSGMSIVQPWKDIYSDLAELLKKF